MNPVILRTIDDTISIGISGKQLGNTSRYFSQDADANFAKFTALFPGKVVYNMPAVGADNIIEIDSLSPNELDQLEADALITRNSSNLLVLKAADCIPLVLYSPAQTFLALAHAGTSSAALHLPGKVITKLAVEPRQLHCYIGPSVSQKSYRFPDKDLSDKKLDDSWRDYVTQETDGLHINLLGYVIDELLSCGLQRQNIIVEPIDTGADQNFFSHRRHKITGEPDGRNCFGVCLV